MRTALRVEALRWKRSVVARLAGLLLVLFVPIAALGMTALARSEAATGAAAAKLADYATGPLATTHLTVAGQILSVAVLVAGGFAFASVFAQPFVGGQVGALFGLAVPRVTVALARCLVISGWALLCGIAAVVLTTAGSVLVTTATGGTFGPDFWPTAVRAVAATVLAVGLALPFAAVATATRSPLATVGVLLGIVAVTQVVVLLGGGAWFPYAAPSLWTGMGGVEAAGAISDAALWLTLAVAPVAAAVVAVQWRRLTDV